jgi:hypothetical protein
MRVLDLFSGLGGFSQAFLDRGHEVTRYDIDPGFKDIPNTEIKDVFVLMPHDLKNYDVILASIDCTNFTYANATPDKDALAHSIALTRHTLQIIQEADPDYYIIENPKGRMRNVLGVPTVTTAWGFWGMPYLKPTDLFGKVPALEWPSRYTEPAPKDTWDMKRFRKSKFSYLAPRESSLRSLVPYPFSLALCIAIENNAPVQSTLSPTPDAISTPGGNVRVEGNSEEVI